MLYVIGIYLGESRHQNFRLYIAYFSPTRRLRGRLAYTPAYAPQQAAYIQPCADQLSYIFLLVKKNSAHM